MSHNNHVQVSTSLVSDIDNIIGERKGWESTELLASNKRLYGILASCMSLIKTYAEKKEEILALADERNVKRNAKTDIISIVLKLIFGDDDRQRISAYAVVLRKAMADKQTPQSLPEWISDNKGVEAIRTGRNSAPQNPGISAAGSTKRVSASTRLDKVKAGKQFLVGIQGSIGRIPTAVSAISATKSLDGFVLMLGRINPDFSTEVITFVADDAALDTALAAIGDMVTNTTSGDPERVLGFASTAQARIEQHEKSNLETCSSNSMGSLGEILARATRA